jgi:hypothetical protein
LILADESRQNQITEGTFELKLKEMCQGFWGRLEEEATLNHRRLQGANLSIKTKNDMGVSQSISAHINLLICTSGEDILQEALIGVENFRRITPTLAPMHSSIISKISFTGKSFKNH